MYRRDDSTASSKASACVLRSAVKEPVRGQSYRAMNGPRRTTNVFVPEGQHDRGVGPEVSTGVPGFLKRHGLSFRTKTVALTMTSTALPGQKRASHLTTTHFVPGPKAPCPRLKGLSPGFQPWELCPSGTKATLPRHDFP